MKKALQVNNTPSPETLIQLAVEKGVPVEVLEGLYNLNERVKAQKAKEAFVKALAEFQNKCPVIEKTKKVLNKDGKSVRYQYAPLESIIEQIRGILAENELSYTWDIKHEDKHMTATARITHSLGHSETSTLSIPIDTEGYMTAPQKYASAQTFAKRYALCNALGISTSEEDTDAVDVGNEKDVKSVKSKIIFLLKSLGFNATTKEAIEKLVKESTQLDLEEKNYSEIVGRLEIMVKEKQEYDKTQNS